MDIATFGSLATRLITNAALFNAARDNIPQRVINEWYSFLAPVRAEAGVPMGTPVDDYQNFTRPTDGRLIDGARLLARQAPVDFLFPETREHAKAEFRALCQAHGIPENAPQQMADIEASEDMMAAARARDLAEFTRLAALLGVEVPTLAGEVFANLTRAEFDAAAVAGETAAADEETLRDFLVSGTNVTDWETARATIRVEVGAPEEVRLHFIDIDAATLDEAIGAPAGACARSIAAPLPVSFLFPETREQFLAAFREALTAGVAEYEALRSAREREQAEQRRRRHLADFRRLGKDLGLLDSAGKPYAPVS